MHLTFSKQLILQHIAISIALENSPSPQSLWILRALIDITLYVHVAHNVENTNTINENMETLFKASREFDLEINLERILFVSFFHSKNTQET